MCLILLLKTHQLLFMLTLIPMYLVRKLGRNENFLKMQRCVMQRTFGGGPIIDFNDDQENFFNEGGGLQ